MNIHVFSIKKIVILSEKRPANPESIDMIKKLCTESGPKFGNDQHTVNCFSGLNDLRL